MIKQSQRNKYIYSDVTFMNKPHSQLIYSQLLILGIARSTNKLLKQLAQVHLRFKAVPRTTQPEQLNLDPIVFKVGDFREQQKQINSDFPCDQTLSMSQLIQTGANIKKRSIDSRQLENKQRSKSDWFAFLKYQGGYHLPSYRRLNTRFLKDFVSGKKLLLKASDVMPFNVPQYEELSVKNLLGQFIKDDKVMMHLNYYDDDGRLPERNFFFGVVGTIHPQYLANLIAGANRNRNRQEAEETKDEYIEISKELLDKIEREPFYSKTKGRTLSLLKAKSKPRQNSKKRQIFEIATPFASFQAQNVQSQSRRPTGDLTMAEEVSPRKRKPQIKE